MVALMTLQRYKNFATAQLVIGSIILILQAIDLSLGIAQAIHCTSNNVVSFWRFDLTNLTDDTWRYDYSSNDGDELPTVWDTYEYPCSTLLPKLAMVVGPFWVGFQFLITGCLGRGSLTTLRPERKLGMSFGYQVMTMINTIFAVPCFLFFLVALTFAFRSDIYNDDSAHHFITLRNVFQVPMGLLGFAGWVVSVIAVSASCCCPPSEVEEDLEAITVTFSDLKSKDEQS